MKTTTRSRKNTQILAGSIAALLLATHSAQAASAAWNVNADGAWVTDSNWTPAAAPGAVTGTASADVATFSNTLTLFGKTITVDTDRNIGGISFGNATAFGFTLTGGNLLLSNAGVIQSLAADGGHMETIASAIAIQGDSGSASFTALSTNGSNLLNIAGAVTGVSTAGNTTTLNLNGTNLGGNEVTGIIGDGSLGGKLALTKSAAGTWFLTGSNTYTGTTTLTAGTLVAENANALGSGGNVTFGGGTLRYTSYSAGADWSTRFKNSTAAGGIILDLNFQDVTLAGVIDSSNTAGLNRSGAGSLTLSGANTYTGVTTIGGNTASPVASYLKLNNALALGGGGNLTFTNGTLQFSSNNTVDYSSRIVGSTSAVNIDTNGQSVTFASPLVASNNAGLTKLGLGSLTLQGASNNAYLNTTTISGGDLIINNTVDNAADRLSSGTLVINGGRLIFNGNASANSAESVGQINVGGGASTLSVNFGGTQTATLTSTGQMVHNLTNGTMLINGVNLGMDNSSTSSVARVLVTTAPTLANLVGTTAALVTGINSAVQNTKIVPFLTGEATTTTGGLGTASGTSNTFVTYVGGAGFRPLNPTDEFTNNAITGGSNTRLTSATTAASTGAINSLVMAGGDLAINDSNAGSLVTLTNTSGAILFTATSTIKPSSTAGVLSFGTAEGQITVNAGVTATIRANMTQTGPAQGITKSGSGTLTLTGNNLNMGGLSVEGGGTVNILGAYTHNGSNSQVGWYIGQSSGGNTVNISGLGSLRQNSTGQFTLGAGIYGNNTVNISTPAGNRTNPSVYAHNVRIGVSSSNNSMTISNGAYQSNNAAGGNVTYRVGENVGANNNSLTVTGAFSVFDKLSGGGGALAVGPVSNGNSLVVSGGGLVLPRRLEIGGGTAMNNSALITGNRSMMYIADGGNAAFSVGNGAGAYGNSFTVANGAVANYTGNSGRALSVGDGIGADNNSFVVDGLGSLARIVNSSQTFNVGGNRGADGGIGNHFDVINGGVFHSTDTSIHLSGTNTSFNLGNGTSVSTVNVAFSNSISSVYLRNASNQLNFNSGRLTHIVGTDLVAGAGSVVLNGPAYIRTALTASKISTVISGAGDLIKEGTGTLILSNTNTFTGTTKVTAGTVALDYTIVGSKLADTSTLTLGGGTLNLRNGASAHVEVVGSTSLNAGLSQVTQTTSTSTLRTNLITPGVGVVNFGAASIADTDNLNDASDAGGILGAWATVGGLNWAVNSTASADGAITAYTGYTSYDAYGSVLANNPANNARLDTNVGAGDITLGAATTTVNTLLQSNTLGAAVVQTAGGVLATKGIMIAANGDALTIGGAAGDGALQSATASGTLVLNNSNSATLLTINAPITDNGGASALATVGAVTLAGVNTYTGATGVGGTLTLDGAAQLGGGTYAGAISIAAAGKLVMNSSANQILSGVISGDGALTQSGLGTTTLSGANTYTGVTTVNGGTLAVGNANAFGPALTASLAFNSVSSGKVQLNGFSIGLNGLSTTSSGATIESGSATPGTDTLTVNVYTTDANFTNSITAYNSYSGILQDGGVRALALTLNGSNGLVLKGTNTYTGGTTINGATIVIGNPAALGTGTVTLGSASVVKQLSTAVGSIGNEFVLNGNVLFDLRSADTLGTNLNSMTLTGNISGTGRILAVGDGTAKTLTLSGAKTFSGGLIQSGQSSNYNIPGGTAVTDRFVDVAIDNVASLGSGQFYARISSTNVSTGVLRSTADLSAGVANPVDIGYAARLVVEASGSNHLKLSGALTGEGNLFKIGSATLTLAGNNTYIGNTTVSAGTLSVSADTNLGASPSLVFDGGSFQVTGTTMQNFGIHTPTFTAAKTVAIDVANAAHTFTVTQVLNQTTGQLTKTGDGTLALSNTNTYTGKTNVNAGVLLLNSAGAVPGGIGAGGGTSQIVFNGGVIGLSNGDFNRSLDFVGLANSANFAGAGGWAAYTADRTVNLGGVAATIGWGTADTGFNSQTLILGAVTADKTVTLVNPLDLGIGDRTLRVDNGTAANDAILSGNLSSTFASLTKTGAGAVQLNGLQAYDTLNANAGTTNVNGLLGTAPGAAAVTVAAGASLKFGTISQNLASLDIGAGSTVTFMGGSASGSFTSTDGGSKAPSFGAAVVPEPGTFGLLLVGALGMLNRRRRQA